MRTIRKLYVYDNGRSLVEFSRGDARDWYVWSPRLGQRLATYRTRKELLAAYDRSAAQTDQYGMAILSL